MQPRHVLLAALLGIVAATFALSELPAAQRLTLYRHLGILAMEPPFFDTYYVLAGFDCERAGIPPTSVCPAIGNGFAYPKTFFLLLPTGLSAHHRVPVAVIVSAAFVAAMYFFFRTVTWPQCAYVAAAVCSPPAWLAIERGNADVLVVALLAAACLWLERKKWIGGALALLTLTTWLKLYPVAALAAAVLRVPGRAWAAAVGACALGLAVQFDHLPYVLTTVPRRHVFSFGYPVLPMAARDWLPRHGYSWPVPAASEALLWGIALLAAVAVALWLGRRDCPRIADLPHAPGLLVGGAIYCFCWFAGTNFFYRYLMLFLTLPFLFQARAVPALAPAARLVLAAMLPMLWLAIRPAATPVREPLALAIASCLLGILGAAAVQAARALPAPFRLGSASQAADARAHAPHPG